MIAEYSYRLDFNKHLKTPKIKKLFGLFKVFIITIQRD